MDLEGTIVEFIDSGALRFGYVRKREQRKVQVVDERGRQSSVPVSRIVVVHPAMPEEDFPAAVDQIQERVEACIGEIDAGLLWESVQADRREFTPAELAHAWFGQASPENESAVFRALTREPLFFRRTGGGFEARTREQVSSERLRIAREEAHERCRRETARILGRALEEKTTPAEMQEEEGWPLLLERLDRWLRRNDGEDVGDALAKIVGESQARDAAYDLLVRYGLIASTEDRFLLVRGIPTVFPKEVLTASHRLSSPIDTEGRTRYPPCETFAIDDSGTVEVDDALTAWEDGREIVAGIHIADVSSFVVKDDPLDREAHRRSSTIYLPNVSVTMFPPRLAADLASLVQGFPRPAFTVEARFSDAGALLGFRFFRSVILVTHCLDYSEADAALEAGNSSLARLYRIAQCLSETRIEQGAQTHRRPDIKVYTRNDKIFVQRVDADTPARLIVSEMMILANRLAAQHAAASGIPIIFRTQEPPKEPRPETEGLPEAIQFELLRKNFKRSRLSLRPSEHAGLGLSSYTQMSSPIRRYADLVTQRQFAAALEGKELPYERDELLEVLTACEARELEIRRLEQTSTTWWILTYLARERQGEKLEAVVVDSKGTVELSEFLVRARLRDREGLHPGDVVTVSVESVDPGRGTIHLRAST